MARPFATALLLLGSEGSEICLSTTGEGFVRARVLIAGDYDAIEGD
jgi:hypothetical protein